MNEIELRIEDIREQRNYKVYKANEIIQRARYQLNITELKVLAFLFSKITDKDEKFKAYTFTVKDYCDVCGIPKQTRSAYDHVKKTLQGLRDKSFWLRKEDGRETTVGWLYKAEILPGGKKLLVKFDEDLQEYIIGLFEHYTQYELIRILPMKHAASIRLYELLKSYSYNHTELTFDVWELRQKLGYESKSYDEFKAFRRRCLQPAVEEINKYTDIEMSYETASVGRKVEKIIFRIKIKDSNESYDAYLEAEEALENKANGIKDTGEIPGQMSIWDFVED